MALSERDYRRGTRNRIKGPGTGTSDDIPAMLSNGEFVVKASSAAKIGDKALNHMNRTGRIPMKALEKMRYGQMRGKRRMKLAGGGWGLLGKGAAALGALYAGKEALTPSTPAPVSPTPVSPTPVSPTPAAPNPNYGGVATPLNQGATNALEERIRRAGGAKGGYVIRRKKMKLGGMAKLIGKGAALAGAAYTGFKAAEPIGKGINRAVDAADEIKYAQERKLKEVEKAAAYGGGAATPKKKYGGGYAWPRKQMMRGGKVMSAKPGRGVISTTGRGPEDGRPNGYTTHGYAVGGMIKRMGIAVGRLAKKHPVTPAGIATGVAGGEAARHVDVGPNNYDTMNRRYRASQVAGGAKAEDVKELYSPRNPLIGLRRATEAGAQAGGGGMAGGGHPGFKAVQAKIAAKSGVPMKNAGAILAASSRRASPAAKRANPRLRRVSGA